MEDIVLYVCTLQIDFLRLCRFYAYEYLLSLILERDGSLEV